MTLIRVRLLAAALFCLTPLAGCETSGVSTSYSVSAGYYSGAPFYDPYYYRPCCGTVVVVRPPTHRPPPSHLPARPQPLPAPLPSRPRPALRR